MPKALTLQIGKLHGSDGQFYVAANKYQGQYRKVLFVCSAGILRSATAAHLFAAEPYNWNTRAVGCKLEYALDPISVPLMEWADHIYVMTQDHYWTIRDIFGLEEFNKYLNKMTVLHVPDNFKYRDPDLITQLKIKVPAWDSSAS